MAIIISLILSILATAPIMYRLLKGPSIADRVAAFDVLTCTVMGMIGILSIKTDNTVYIDVVLTMSFVVFLGAIAFAYYMEKRKK
ncbi:MAG: cation:proton antiporter [Bacteroidetes bacterium]|nr:cation:proton antiporter [Bacteroidota bacterium]